MLVWLKARFLRSSERASNGDNPSVPPAWAVTLGERLQVIARAQSKLSLRLDDLASTLQARDVAQERADRDRGPDPGPVLDALDRLEEARRVVADAHPAVGEGLRRITARLEGFLGAMGVQRRASTGMRPDPDLFRVVGVECAVNVPPGGVTRVIRSAAVRGSTVLREGEVFVCERASTS